jgi:hypothetical protein
MAALSRFETSGDLAVPMATLHTTGDPIVPYSQSPLYGQKVHAAGQDTWLSQTTVNRFGHCSFTQTEVLTAFSNLWSRIGGFQPAAVAALGRR